MLTTINGLQYLELLSLGVDNVERHQKTLNDLNVFPVPDGDTGTNMAMTMKQGLVAARSAPAVLSDVSASFSSAAVFGARGNSGVIVSQLFKGLAEGFRDTREADAAKLFEALRSGVRFAYASVARPIEGTILTVLREATDVLGAALPLDSVDEAIAIFLAAARESLEKTPELLPVLKKAGVVDSGASGIVYFFDGIDRGIRGVPPEDPDTEESVPESRGIDLTLFNKDTRFEYGYCVEGLIQLNRTPSDFDYSEQEEEGKDNG